MKQLERKLEALRTAIRGVRSCLVAYSGGVDSALVLAIANEVLGDRAIGCIGVSPSFPERERRAAVALADQVGARWRLIEPAEHERADYAANPHNRCYFCKQSLFDCLRGIATSEGWHAILDGAHADDVVDHVHGLRAAAERGVRSPLLEHRFTKQDVRDAARALGLPVWSKPALACLASRVPHGTAITPALLRQIEAAEDVLWQHNLSQCRVRHHGEIARIEVTADEMPTVLEHRESIVDGIHSAGYRYVTLDLAGFRAPITQPVEIRILAHR